MGGAAAWRKVAAEQPRADRRADGDPASRGDLALGGQIERGDGGAARRRRPRARGDGGAQDGERLALRGGAARVPAELEALVGRRCGWRGKALAP